TIQHPIRPINPARRSAAVTDGEDEARLQPAVQRRSGEESVSLSLSLLVPSLSTSDFHKEEEQAVDLGVVVVKRATMKKGAQVAKIPNPRAAAAEENIKERKLRRKLRTEESVNVKQQPANEATVIGGVARKREDLIIFNIDEASGDDELAVAEYVEDIYKFYKLTEGESQVCDYMGKQPDIDEKLRSILVDWLICRPTNISP
ncbi:hypothetical protein Dimus_007849, partial [Dionaea muscipula]